MDARTQRILIGLAAAVVVLLGVIIIILVTGDDTPEAASTTATSSPTSTLPAGSSTTSPPPITLPATTAPTTTIAGTTTTSEATTTSTTTATTTSTTTTTTTTTLPGGACSELPSTSIPTGATDQTVAGGDVDGDGTDDQVTVYRSAGSFWLRVETGYGWGTEIALPGMVARAISVTGMGVPEEVVVAQVDAGASAELIGFFAFQECSIVQIYEAAGFNDVFPVGAAVTHAEGLSCTPDGIQTRSAVASPNDPSTWEYTETDYLYVPGLAEFQPTASSTVVLRSPDDDDVIFGAAEFSGC